MKLFEDLMEASAKFADKAAKVATEAFEQTKVVAGEAMDKGKKKVNELELKIKESLVVRAEKDCQVYCPICHKILDVKEGQPIPRCCGKPMEVWH